MRLLNQRRAVTAIEYALIAAIMAMVIVTGISLFGGNFGGTITHVTDTLGSAPAVSAPAAATAAAGSNQTGSHPAATSTPGATSSSGPTIQVNAANPAGAIQ